MPDYLPIITAVANLLVAVGALIVFIGIFVLLVRVGRAVEMFADQYSGGSQSRDDGPPG